MAEYKNRWAMGGNGIEWPSSPLKGQVVEGTVDPQKIDPQTTVTYPKTRDEAVASYGEDPRSLQAVTALQYLEAITRANP